MSGTVFNAMILDKEHLLKNPDIANVQAARAVAAHHRVVLSGTPVQNNVGELWTTMDFCMPLFLGSLAAFSKSYGKVIQESVTMRIMSTEAEQKLKGLHQIILHFILGRTKNDVLESFPKSTV